MNFDDSFPSRVAIARTALGLTQDELAQKVGVVRRQIAAYEGGEAKPRIQALQNLAAALGTTTDWLINGQGSGPDTSSIKRTITVREIPIFTNLKSVVLMDGEWTMDGSVSGYTSAPNSAGEGAFAYRVEGDSMDAPAGVSFPHGTLVIFDPDIKAHNGDFILCSLPNEDKITFKRLIKDQHSYYLKSLNLRYPFVKVPSGTRFFGVAIHSQLDLLALRKQNDRYSFDLWGDPALDNSEIHDSSLSERLSALENRLDEIMHLIRKG